MSFVRKLSLGGSGAQTSGGSASTYVGDINDIWADDVDFNTLRRGDGITPGGIPLGSTAEQNFTIHTADFNATTGSRHAVDTSSNVVTATLPASPSVGDAIFFADAGGNYHNNNLTIGRNGNTIMGSATDITVDMSNQSLYHGPESKFHSFGLFYNGSTWRIY